MPREYSTLHLCACDYGDPTFPVVVSIEAGNFIPEGWITLTSPVPSEDLPILTSLSFWIVTHCKDLGTLLKLFGKD